ncbi:MAG TPA: DUF6624 domain-containing protein [Puia sp.]|jgi:hypothetical protein|nr:DUF6624 domain-containing protein [Puia sp.]
MVHFVPLFLFAAAFAPADTLPQVTVPPPRRDSIVQVLIVVDEDDQKYRTQMSDMQEKKEVDSAAWKELMVKMRETDSINLVKLQSILEKYSWLGADVIGEQCNTAMFMVIQHADLPIQEKYLPMIREAAAAGRAQPRHLAMLEDRVALREGRKQRYGTQLKWNERVKAYRLAPMEDPDHVDERRKAVGLSPLAIYLAQWGLNWDVEEYKKEGRIHEF